MIVVFAEKPDAGRNFARILGATHRKDGYLEGNGYQVTWGFGHLVGIAEPKDMCPDWGTNWSMDQLPMLPESFKLRVLKGKGKQFKVVKSLLQQADEIINATDAGREGELIFRYVAQLAGVTQKSVKRLWISDLNDESIRKGFQNLRDGRDMIPLGDAAQCRSESDWLVGLNATRGYTVHNGQLCTVGRVQTPTLALIVNRLNEIQNFSKSFFYEVYGQAKKDWFQWFQEDGTRIEDEEQASVLAERLQGQEGRITGVETEPKKTKPPMLFYLAELQRACNKKFGWSAKETLNRAQELYEKEKLITYPRTSSQHLSEAMVPQFQEVIQALPGELDSAKDVAMRRVESGVPLGKRFVDDSKLSDHHAIIPTKAKMEPTLRSDLKDLYMLIAKRFLSVFFSEFVQNVTTVLAEVDGETLKARGTQVVTKGWKALINEETDREKTTMLESDFEEGETVLFYTVESRQKETKPPKPYTEGTLITAMEKAGKHLENDELAEKMKGCGLGQESTRAEIIERLVRSGYVERNKKQLMATKKGFELIQTVAPILKSPDLTAGWEMMLEEMERGACDPHNFMKGIREIVGNMVPEITGSKKLEAPKTDILGSCPICQGDVYENRVGFKCMNHRTTGCKFIIWKEIAGQKITAAIAKEILTLQPTKLLKGFKSKANKPFQAHLFWNPEKNYIDFRFPHPPKRKVLGTCPQCKGQIISNQFGFGCENWEQGCKVQISKKIAGVTINEKLAKQILECERSELVTGLKSRAGKTFSAYLSLEGERVVMHYPKKREVS